MPYEAKDLLHVRGKDLLLICMPYEAKDLLHVGSHAPSTKKGLWNALQTTEEYEEQLTASTGRLSQIHY